MEVEVGEVLGRCLVAPLPLLVCAVERRTTGTGVIGGDDVADDDLEDCGW
jgi:hypothetical protein